MAHELSIRKNGFVEMMYVGNKPWHGLGNEVAKTATVDECIAAAGMDFTLLRSKVRYATSRDADATATYRTLDDKHVIFRSDTKEAMSVVSDGFKIVQPRETMEFFREFVEAGGFHISTAGILRGGRKFWAQAESNLEDVIIGNDLMKGKLLIATSCDGTMNTVVKPVTEAVVCANTLAMALGESGAVHRTSHRSVFDPKAAKEMFGLTPAAFATFISNARELANYKVSKAEADAFILKVVADIDFAKEKTHDFVAQLDEARESAGYRKVLELFSGSGRGANAPGRRGTAWGLVNAVTEYVDHHKRARSVDNRIDAAWFGSGDEMKTRALDEALVYVNA